MKCISCLFLLFIGPDRHSEYFFLISSVDCVFDCRNWNLLAPWQGAKIYVPTELIVGDKDIGFESFGTKDQITGGAFRNFVPNAEVVIIDGHHFIHQERAEEVTAEIMAFFSRLAKDE